MKGERIIIALDVDTIKEEERLVDMLSPYIRIFKVGMQLFYSCGPKAVEVIKKYDRDVFLDLKFFDIPNTVRYSSKLATALGVFMFNVHTQGGTEMMAQAVDGAEEEAERMGVDRPLILGVTVLTSMDRHSLRQVGIESSPREEVLRLAHLARDSGLDGVVASSQEAGLIREKLGKDFLIVTPGVRPAGAVANDQRRIATPEEAFKSGVDYIVIGRPVIKAKEPLKTIKGLIEI